MTQTIKIEKEFRNIKEIKEIKNAISSLTGCDDVLLKIYIQGTFSYVRTDNTRDELNLEYNWYEVKKIGNSYIYVYIPEYKKTYKVYPSLSMMTYRKPSFRIIAENFTNISIIYQ